MSTLLNQIKIVYGLFGKNNMKSDNLQYNTLVGWVDGTNYSSTKHLTFQDLFFFQNFLQTYALSFYRSQTVLGWSKFFCKIKDLFTFCGSHKLFWRGTKCSQILVLAQKFGPAQNVLGPVKGQGIRALKTSLCTFL